MLKCVNWAPCTPRERAAQVPYVLAQKTSSTGKARLRSFRENKHLQKEGLILNIMWQQTLSNCEATAVTVVMKKHERCKNKSYEKSPFLSQHSQCAIHRQWCCNYISPPHRHRGITRIKICVTVTAMASHTHENKHTRGVFQNLLWDGELKYTLLIQPPEFCCVTGTLHSCSKGDKANLVHVHLLHLPCLKVRLHNPDCLPVGKIQMPNSSHSRSFSNTASQSLRNYQ